MDADQLLKVMVAGPPVKASVPTWKTEEIRLLATRIRASLVYCISNAGGGSSRERLTNQVLLARRVVLVGLQVGDVLLCVGAEACDGAGSDEAVDLHLAVHADPEVPLLAGLGDGAGRLADGVDIAKAGEPDHKLVVAAAVGVVRVRRREDVVGDVGAHALRRVAPRRRRLHAADGANELALRNLPSAVDVALDVVGPALPRPRRVELYATTRTAVYDGALVA